MQHMNSTPRKRVRKAVFPVAGLGTRFLPATKAVPKEMLTVVDKPVIQYVVDEARAAGIEHLVFVTGRNKGVIEKAAVYDAAHIEEALCVLVDKGVRDGVRKAHPPAFLVEPEQVVAELIGFRRPQLTNVSSPGFAIIAHDHTSALGLSGRAGPRFATVTV